MQLIKVNPAEFGIEETKAAQMVSGLQPIIEERLVLAEQYSEVIRLELVPNTLKAARELRLRIRDNRTKGVEKWHKANKEFYLAGGRFVDAIKNKEVAENIRMEDALEQIEKHFENLEKQRIADLQKEREALLAPYEVENAQQLQLGTMPADVWEGFLIGQQVRYEQRKEAERQAEAERQRLAEIEKLRFQRSDILRPFYNFIPDDWEVKLGEISNDEFDGILSELTAKKEQHETEQARIKAENERLRKEAEAKQAQEAKKREELYSQMKERQKDAETFLKENGFEYYPDFGGTFVCNKINLHSNDFCFTSDNELLQFKERVLAQLKSFKLEAELKAKKEAEAKAERERLAEAERQRKEAEKLAKAPVKKQLTVWVDSFELPPLSTQHDLADDIFKKFEAFKNWAKTQIELL